MSWQAAGTMDCDWNIDGGQIRCPPWEDQHLKMACEYRTTHNWTGEVFRPQQYLHLQVDFLLDCFQIGDKPDEEEDDVVEHTDDGEWALVADVL